MTISKTNIVKLDLSELMRKAQDGDEHAYSVLLDHLYEILRRYLTKKIFNNSLVEDALQDVMLAIHRSRHTYDPSKPFLPWVFAVTKYRTINFLKKISKEVTESDTSIELTDIADTEKTYARLHNKWEIEELLKVLTDNQADLLMSVKIDGLSVKEAAQKFNLSMSNVKTTVHRAIAKLKGEVRL